jgi:N-acetylglutamate synthase-like GNAT family acetyltransferase
MAVMNGGKSANNMVTTTTKLRKATTRDLDAINKIIDAAVMTWNLPERVKRLSLPSYHYQSHDLETLEIVLAENSEQQIVGVAAWEPANPGDIPQGQRTLLLHGIYVNPQRYRQGIGRQLLQAAEQAALAKGYSALLVKAQADAAGFFQAQGMQPLEVENEKRDYPHRYWKLIDKR